MGMYSAQLSGKKYFQKNLMYLKTFMQLQKQGQAIRFKKFLDQIRRVCMLGNNRDTPWLGTHLVLSESYILYLEQWSLVVVHFTYYGLNFCQNFHNCCFRLSRCDFAWFKITHYLLSYYIKRSFYSNNIKNRNRMQSYLMVDYDAFVLY